MAQQLLYDSGAASYCFEPLLRHPLSVVSSSRRIMRRIGMALVGLIVALFALAVAGAIYQTIATKRAERAYPPPGEMVDVGDYSLHIHCVGQGSPTVVLDGGSGEMSASWSWCSGRSPIPHACAPTTARGWAGARRAPNPGMPSRSRANCTLCSLKLTSKALTCWLAIRSAACTCRPTPPGILRRWQAWP